MYQRNQISKKAVSFLSPTDCKAARFYLLPKIHKPGNPGRPIISAMGPPPRRYPCLWTTSSNLLFLRLILISMTLQISSGNLKISKTKSPVQPSSVLSTSLLCTLTSLMLKVSQPRVQPCLRRSTLVHPSLTHQVLTKNNFTFMDKHYLQRHGTPWEPGWLLPMHACLCLALKNACSVNFLDVTVRKEHGSLSTDLYTKPTDTHTSISILQAAIPVTASLELPTVKHFVFVAFALTIPLSFAIQMLWKNTLLPGAIVPEGKSPLTTTTFSSLQIDSNEPSLKNPSSPTDDHATYETFLYVLLFHL
ncbi:hypothetical protein BSL78_16380 [Apostichopus japonicus]|uniref:Uncharacterized protein n=1 Tax=Stichopus japonicus TaxID=307972 RepID=A0A2G8KFG8_STIJA|nr:hypothetical protein BSL78_16380 [Apostichopus japonicus]